MEERVSPNAMGLTDPSAVWEPVGNVDPTSHHVVAEACDGSAAMVVDARLLLPVVRAARGPLRDSCLHWRQGHQVHWHQGQPYLELLVPTQEARALAPDPAQGGSWLYVLHHLMAGLHALPMQRSPTVQGCYLLDQPTIGKGGMSVSALGTAICGCSQRARPRGSPQLYMVVQ